jgi:predicted dienelactone hydrolase
LQVLLRDARFKVAAPMAPGVFAELLARSEHVTAPTLVMAGDLDRLTRLADEELLSASLKAGGGEHWFVVLRGAGHLSFADLCSRIFGGCGPGDLTPAEAHSAIDGWATAFVQRYLNGDERYAAWMESNRSASIDVRSPIIP